MLHFKMEVTRDNFLKVLPEIECAINEADFIAIDGEFTGLGTDLPAKVVYDTPAQRYSRLRQGLTNYIIIQYGLCTFKWSKEALRYIAKPFNIYIFPRASNRNDTLRRFQCQSSSIEFLASQGFDFNKLFYKGLSYVSPEREDIMRQNMAKWAATNNSNDILRTPKSMRSHMDESKTKTPIFIPEIMKTFVDDICEKVKAFAENKEDTVLELPPASSFRRKLTYDVIEERYPHLHLESVSMDKGEKYLKVMKVDEDERTKLLENMESKKKAEFETAVGFLKIAQLLSSADKLIIGHNMLLDTMLTIGQFFAPLPETLEEFKELEQTLFPKVMDTKLLASTQPLKDKLNGSRLGDLYACACENLMEPKIAFAEGFESYTGNSEKFHEAGYDAFCTGVCFAKMATQLCSLQSYDNMFKPIDLDSQILQPFLNRIFVMRINDLNYINMAGPDDVPERKNVFHLIFPSTWRYSDINQLFDDYGHVHTSFQNSTSALVSLSREDLVDKVIQDLIINKKEPGPCKVTTYAKWAGLENTTHSNNMTENTNSNSNFTPTAGNRKRKNSSEDLDDQTLRKSRKKKRKEDRSNHSLEEGELSDSSMSSTEDATVEKILPAKQSIELEKARQRTIAKSTEKDFLEPDEW